MEKPKAPESRRAGLVGVEVSRDYLSLSTDWEEVPVCSVEEAEMLIFALQEWIEYKRQLEKWNREHVL